MYDIFNAWLNEKSMVSSEFYPHIGAFIKK